MNENQNTRIDIKNIDIDKLQTLDDFMAMTQPITSIEKANTNLLYGINHTRVLNTIPKNRDSNGK